jgi:type VI protein secretion system component VasF
MRDTPTHRGLPPELDRTSHERRARLIAQLHRQAIATANDLAVRQKAIKVDIAKDARRRKIEAWLFVAGAIIVALGAVLALLAMM